MFKAALTEAYSRRRVIRIDHFSAACSFRTCRFKSPSGSMEKGRTQGSGQMSVTTCCKSGSDVAIKGAVKEWVSLQYNNPCEPTRKYLLHFVIRPAIAASDTVATAHFLCAIPREMLSTFREAKQNNCMRSPPMCHTLFLCHVRAQFASKRVINPMRRCRCRRIEPPTCRAASRSGAAPTLRQLRWAAVWCRGPWRCPLFRFT